MTDMHPPRDDENHDTAGDRESPAGADWAPEGRLWLRLLTCTTMIERNLRRLLKREFGATLPRFDALAQLHREPNGLTMGALSERMMVTNGNVTGLVDRLVDDGLAERIARQGDRRSHVVRLTDRGRKEFEAMTPDHHARVHDLLSGLDADDLETLQVLLGKLKRSVRAAEREVDGNT